MTTPAPAPLAWAWRVLDEARTPRAAVAFGPAAARLLARAAATPPERRAGWTATAAPDMIVVMGPATTLPWADGVRYAAPHPEAPSLWLPAHAEPDAPADLLWRALSRRSNGVPVLLWSDGRSLPLDRALPVDDALLAAIDARAKGPSR